jgi:GTP cyclohydrolase I
MSSEYTDSPMFLQESATRVLKHYTGLNTSNAHGADTTRRFLSMLGELTSCATDCDGRCIRWKDFPSSSNDMVVVQEIPFTSMCNHHIVPFVGFAHIAYIPRERVVGLSKFARTVHHFARRLQVQEDLTYQIANHISEKLQPEGVAVVMRAEHLCMTIRGVQAPGTYTTTARMTGAFADHNRTAKQEFLQYLNGRH